MKKNDLLKLHSGAIFKIKYDDQYLVTYIKVKNIIQNIGRRDIYGVDNFYNLECDVNEDMTMDNSYFKKVEIFEIFVPEGFELLYSKFKEVKDNE